MATFMTIVTEIFAFYSIFYNSFVAVACWNFKAIPRTAREITRGQKCNISTLPASFFVSSSFSTLSSLAGKLGGNPKVAISRFSLSAQALIGIPVQCIPNGYKHFFPFKCILIKATSFSWCSKCLCKENNFSVCYPWEYTY